jgi:hypothetical protein
MKAWYIHGPQRRTSIKTVNNGRIPRIRTVYWLHDRSHLAYLKAITSLTISRFERIDEIPKENGI